MSCVWKHLLEIWSGGTVEKELRRAVSFAAVHIVYSAKRAVGSVFPWTTVKNWHEKGDGGAPSRYIVGI